MIMSFGHVTCRMTANNAVVTVLIMAIMVTVIG
jgi:hypothetical protein